MNSKILILIVFCAVFTNGNVIRKKRLAAIQSDLQLFASSHIREFRFARSSLHLECYDAYIPEINRIAEEGKNASERCIENADLNKKIVESQVGNETTSVATNVNKLQQSLAACQNLTEIIAFLECQVGSADENKALVEAIANASSSLIKKLKVQYNSIELEENKCIDSAVNEAKNKTEETFNNLQFCLSHGLPTAAPTTAPPSTELPTTVPATTVVETTAPPSTVLPTTAPPSTVAETTAPPSTVLPTTAAPSTVAETTVAETTVAETTGADTTVQTNVPTVGIQTEPPETTETIQDQSVSDIIDLQSTPEIESTAEIETTAEIVGPEVTIILPDS